MTKITKIGNDGKEHEYWQFTEEEIAERQKRIDEMKNRTSRN